MVCYSFAVSTVRYCQIEAHEPIVQGVQNLAPTPFNLLNSVFNSINLRSVCNKYKIDADTISIRIVITRNEDKSFFFDRKIKIKKEIEPGQKAFLLEQANFSPTTILLKKEAQLLPV